MVRSSEIAVHRSEALKKTKEIFKQHLHHLKKAKACKQKRGNSVGKTQK